MRYIREIDALQRRHADQVKIQHAMYHFTSKVLSLQTPGTYNFNCRQMIQLQSQLNQSEQLRRELELQVHYGPHFDQNFRN